MTAGMVDIDEVVDLARRVKVGELSQDEALAAVALLAGEDPDDDPPGDAAA